MKYCINCGVQIPEEAAFCPECGTANPKKEEPSVQVYNSQSYNQNYNPENDLPSTGLNVLSFFFPIVGLILFLVLQEKTPLRARACGKFALIGFIIKIVFGILSVGCSALLMFSGF